MIVALVTAEKTALPSGYAAQTVRYFDPNGEHSVVEVASKAV